MFGEFLSAHRSEVVERCLVSLRQECPDRTDVELMDNIPAFVDDLIVTLQRESGRLHEDGESEPGESRAHQHGIVRKSQGFDVVRLVHDFGLICDAVNTTALQHDEKTDPRENQILNRWVDNGIALALESFIKKERADEQRKRAMDLGFLAHEIRNSVSNAVIGFQLIQKGKAPANGSVAAAVERALARITALVMDTIEAAQALNNVAAVRSRVRLKEIFYQLTVMPGTERGIRLNTEIVEDLHVEADPRLLVSALTNLLQNAVKFSRDNECIWLRARVENNSVNIEVEDRCGGLPDSEIHSLFHPFVQKTNDPRGAGLGLAIAVRAIEAQGGTLNVRNMPGVGCVFSVQLPHPL